MRMENERGVSPVIATILLIALTVVAVGIVAAFMSTISLGGPSVSFVSYTANSITFKNNGPDLSKSDLRLLVNDEVAVNPVASSGTWVSGTNLTISGGTLGTTENLAAGDNVKLYQISMNKTLIELTLT